jgi:Zn-dependent oligopeptidase
MTNPLLDGNPLLQCTDLPKFTSIESSQLTTAMTMILTKLESDFAALEKKMVQEVKVKESMTYDEVLPVLEMMQHPLVTCCMS